MFLQHNHAQQAYQMEVATATRTGSGGK